MIKSVMVDGAQALKMMVDGTVAWERGGLPSGYKRCKFIQSDGRQWIDTGYIFADRKLKIEQKFRKNKEATRNAYGVDKNKNGREMHGHMWDNGLYLGNSRVISTGNNYLNEDVEFSFEIFESYSLWIINGKQYEYYGMNGWDGAEISDYLFCTNSGGGATYIMNGRIYYHRMYDSSLELVRNYIPCIDQSGVPCMYDTVTKQPFYNKGTGEFLYELA